MFKTFKPKSEFSKNVLTLMTGTTIAQAIPIAISPILTRLYTPEDFGIFALYISIASLISVIATGRYELAIMLPKKDDDAVNIVAISILITIFISLITLTIVFLCNAQITKLLGSSEISSWLYIIPLTILLTGVYQSLNYWSNRKKQYRRLATNKVLQSTTTATSNVALGLQGIGASGLVIGQIVGHLIVVISLGISFLKLNFSNILKINRKKLFLLARKYIDYPKKSAVGALFNSLAYQIEIILLAIFYSSYLLGVFFLLQKIINIPKQFISSSIWQVFLTHAGEDKQVIFNAMIFKQKKVILYTTFPFLLSLIFFSDLFIWVFGEDWKDVAGMITPLIFAMHISFSVSSFSLFTIINRPDAEMFFNILLAVLKVLAILLSYLLWQDIFKTILAFSIVQFGMFYFLGSWNYVQLGKDYLFFSKLYLPMFIFSTVILIIGLFVLNDIGLWQSMVIYFLLLFTYFGILKYAKQ